MAYKVLRLKITGESPLLLHNGQMADPLNSFAKMLKEISGKRNKTEADYREMSRIEWYASLYLMDGKICIPGENIESCFVEGARKTRVGKAAQAGVICQDNPLIQYDGPQSPDELWLDERFRLVAGVKIKGSRIMRTRPIFRQWGLTFDLMFNDLLLNRSQTAEIIKTSGEIVGLGDWRPKFGRFTVDVLSS